MPFVVEEKFLKTLSEIGFTSTKQSWNWLIDYEPSEEFMEWFCQNINTSNYLSDDELNEYNELESSGSVLEGDELEMKILELFPEYSELCSIDEDYTSALKDEENYLESHHESLERWVKDLQNEVLDVHKDISEFEKGENSIQNKLVNAQKNCLGKASSLESSLLRLNNHLNCQKQYSMIGRNIRNPQFFAEFPIEKYMKESEEFSIQLGVNVDKIVSAANTKHNCVSSFKENFEAKLDKLKEGLENSLLLRVKEEIERRGLESACEHVEGLLQNRKLWAFSSRPITIIEKLSEQAQNIQRMKVIGSIDSCDPYSYEVIMWDSSNMQRNKLREIIEMYTKEQCMKLECLQQELVLLEKQTTFGKLKNIFDVLKVQCATDLIYMFLLGEEVTEVLNLVELANSGEEFVVREQRERVSRIENMKNLKERREFEARKSETWCLIYFLLNYFKTYSQETSSLSVFRSFHSPSPAVDDISSSLKELIKHNENLASEKSQLQNSIDKLSENMLNALQKTLKEMEAMKGLIFNGSTKSHAVLCPVNQLMFLHQWDPLLLDLKNRVKNLKEKYKNEKQKNSMQKHIQKVLWAIFLTNPEEMKAIINQV